LRGWAFAAPDAMGGVCTGEVHPSLPLTSQIYLDGDLFTNAPGIQICPVCNGTCTGGTNTGGPCNTNTECPGGRHLRRLERVSRWAERRHGVHAGRLLDPQLPVRLPDQPRLPPPAANSIGGLPIAFDLTTGTQTQTAVNSTASGQNNVFCGFCRDISALGSGCFEGDPTATCPSSSTVRPCSSNADCTNASFPDCEQRNPGAFGPAGGGAHTITVTGSPAGNMTDGTAHPSTLASIFCIQPTFNATVDAAGDLPGPGAVTLQGTAQLE
jgi:hypothetical protein